MENSASTDRAMHKAALRIAVRCRRVVQACLREEEWRDADREFYEVIREGLRDFVAAPEHESGVTVGGEA